jgi:hypothetical protein
MDFSVLETDIQQAFYLVVGPYITGFLLPVVLGSGLLLALLMATARFWRPRETVDVNVVGWEREE